jgi:MFS superfamily sulfate permease-like transporter
VLAGFLVFLIAMPLCLAIARASGYPPIAGIWTAVIGGIVCTLLSNAQLTIKGPAAGLIVIVYGAVSDLGAQFGADLNPSERAYLGYRLALGIGVVAGLLQVALGWLRAGKLAEFFPLTPVYGMLASIGIIIIAKQIYEVVGVPANKGVGPLVLLVEFPFRLGLAHWPVMVIGLTSLALLFGLPWVAPRYPWLKRVPVQLVVLVLAVVLGALFGLEEGETFPQRHATAPEEASAVGGLAGFLVQMPEVLQNPAAAFAFPDFRGLGSLVGLQYLLLFSVIGSLESLLSAKAVDLLDPWRRRSDLDRDLMAVGVANTLASLVGGLPMISEIVRSKANIDSGAQTRWANLYHGVFLLGFVLLFPWLIQQIPLAALGAMLVYTGFRLASPQEFVRTFQIGSEQFLIFVGTILATLATDLLIGILVGITLKLLFHLWNGAPLASLLKAEVQETEHPEGGTLLIVQRSALFSNWLGLRRHILLALEKSGRVVLDLSQTRLVDHSVMEKLHQLEREAVEQGRTLEVVGLDDHQPMSLHPRAARIKA